MYTEEEGYNHSREYIAGKVVDRVGTGDCFMAGLIYGLYKKMPLKETVEFATAAAYNKLFIFSDATSSTVEKIKKTMSAYQGHPSCLT